MGALLRDLGGSLDELLAFHGIGLAHQGEMLRREGRDAFEGKGRSRRADRIPNGKDTGVEDAENIPRVGFLHNLPFLRHHLLRLG